MPRDQPSAVICIGYIYRIPVKPLLCTAHTVGRRIDQSPYRALSLILKREAPLIFFTFPDAHDNMGLREYYLRLGDVEISPCKTFDLVLQIRHLLKILVSAQMAERRYYELYHHCSVTCNGVIKEILIHPYTCIQFHSNIYDRTSISFPGSSFSSRSTKKSSTDPPSSSRHPLHL